MLAKLFIKFFVQAINKFKNTFSHFILNIIIKLEAFATCNMITASKIILPCHHTLASTIPLEQCMQEFPLWILVVNAALRTEKIPTIRNLKSLSPNS